MISNIIPNQAHHEPQAGPSLKISIVTIFGYYIVKKFIVFKSTDEILRAVANMPLAENEAAMIGS